MVQRCMFQKSYSIVFYAIWEIVYLKNKFTRKYSIKMLNICVKIFLIIINIQHFLNKMSFFLRKSMYFKDVHICVFLGSC